jgi:hypothetical protein
VIGLIFVASFVTENAPHHPYDKHKNDGNSLRHGPQSTLSQQNMERLDDPYSMNDDIKISKSAT